MQESSLQSEARSLSKLALQLGLTQSAIAIALSISQSQVSRVLSGQGKLRSKHFDRVCKYVNSKAIQGQRLSIVECPELLMAIESVWDGSIAHGHALATVIRSLGALRTTEKNPEHPPAKER